MKALLKLDWRAATHSTRNVAAIIAFLLLAILFVPVARYQHVGDLATVATHAHDRLKVAADDIQRYTDAPTPTLRRTADLLNRQIQAQNAVIVGVKLGNAEDIRDGLLEGAKLERQGAKTGYLGVVDATLPTWTDGQRHLLAIQALIHQKRPVHVTIQDAASAMEQCLPLLALALPFLIMLLTADLWLVNAAHPTVTATLPVKLPTQALTKVLTRVALPLIITVSIIGVGALAAALQGGLGDWQYPVVVALGQRMIVVPLWAQTLLLLGFAVIESLFVCALMLVLNAWLRNVYWSFLAGAAIAAIPLAFPAVARTLWFTPLAGLAPQSLFNGTFQNEAGNWALGLAGGAGVLLVWTGLMIALFAQIVDRRQA
ncbi:hypothetical protein [Lacticaseibacillus absianus]|uniref:hypothetical protein n=1 Tax=Lacticaseibacillus absianus TaxID=2729623 RepID=UPI0015CAC9B7|nr:hypothetical protein [Lacticaseibacillus absianus]